MLKIFGGMILGSMMTMMILGGPSAADQVLANAQTLYVDQLNRPNATTTVVLLVILSICMMGLSLWPSKPTMMKTEKVIKRLRRHCK